MSDKSAIEWTDATWNPIIGCSVISPGCKHCYAMRLAGTRLRHHHSREGLTIDSAAGPVWNGTVRLIDQWLDQPPRWRRPRKIFVCAHGDLFHEAVPDEWIDRVFAVMALAPQHTFQVLTKRAERMRAYFTDEDLHNRLSDALGKMLDGEWIWKEGKRFRPKIEKAIAACFGFDINDDMEEVAVDDLLPLPNVWLGVSAEDQQRADERVPHLLATPAAKRFVSAEPLLGPIELRDWWLRAPTECEGCDADGRGGRSLHFCPVGACPHDKGIGRLDGVIVGGESGPGARPMQPAWPRKLRDDCVAAGVAFFFKQWGEWAPWDDDNWSLPDGCDDGVAHGLSQFFGGVEFLRVGKKAAGARLDGREWRELPA